MFPQLQSKHASSTFLLAGLLCFPAAVSAQEAGGATTTALPTASSAAAVSAGEVRTLVVQLGSESFQERQAAETAIREIGPPARSALETGLADADLQIRRSCRRLLNDILDVDYQQRLARFLGDDEGQLEHELPGWERFRELAGEGKQARKIFGEMHHDEGPLLISAEAGDAAAAEALELRLRNTCQMMQHRQLQLRAQPSTGSVAALLFVASDPELNLPESLSDSSYWLQIAGSQNFRAALSAGDTSACARKILGQWVRYPFGQRLLSQKLRLASQYQLPEGLEAALELLEQGEKTPAPYTCVAVEAVAKLGGKAQAARIAPLLDDTRLVVQQIVNQKRVGVEVRDVALGWLVYLTDQDHAAYNLTSAKAMFARLKGNPASYSVSYSYMRFSDEQQRNAAFAKWKAWVAEHPLPEAAPVGATPAGQNAEATP